MHPIRLLWLISLLGASSVFAAAPAETLRVRHAWIRDAPPSAHMRAGYAVLENVGGGEIEIVAASSPDFGLVEIHETRMENDVARMVELGSVKIVAGTSFQLKPGGAHLMLMQPKRALAKGDSTAITLRLKSGATVVTRFVVGPPLQ